MSSVVTVRVETLTYNNLVHAAGEPTCLHRELCISCVDHLHVDDDLVPKYAGIVPCLLAPQTFRHYVCRLSGHRLDRATKICK